MHAYEKKHNLSAYIIFTLKYFNKGLSYNLIMGCADFIKPVNLSAQHIKKTILNIDI